MRHHRLAAAITSAVVLTTVGQLATAQERHDERYDRGGYRVDERAREHDYPRRGAYVEALPRDAMALRFRNDRYFFRGGVWYHPDRGRYVVIAPPVGIIVPTLPPAYTTVYAGNTPYYYANGVYYNPVPGQGYVVVDPPPGTAYPDGPPPPPGYAPPVASSPQPGPQSAPPSGPGQPGYSSSSSEPIVYPRNGQPPEQMARDRGDCGQWATGQANGSSDPSVFDRAFDACMDGRGYTVR